MDDAIPDTWLNLSLASAEHSTHQPLARVCVTRRSVRTYEAHWLHLRAFWKP